MSGHAQLTYADLDKAFAFLRGSEDEDTAEAVADHPEFYGCTTANGIHRAALPTLSDRETTSFRDAEDVIISRIDREKDGNGDDIDEDEEAFSAFMALPPRQRWIGVTRNLEPADRQRRPARGTCRPRVIDMSDFSPRGKRPSAPKQTAGAANGKPAYGRPAGHVGRRFVGGAFGNMRRQRQG